MARAEIVAPKPGTFLAQIVSVLNTFGDKLLPIPHKTNVDRMLGEAYLWDEVARYAKKKSDAIWEKMEDEDIVRIEKRDPGSYVLAEGRMYVAAARVSQPVKRFDVSALAEAMKKKYKVPLPVTVEMVEQAKLPSSSQTTLSIAEK